MLNFINNQKSRSAEAEAAAPDKAAVTSQTATSAENGYVEKRIAEIEEQRLALQKELPDFDMKKEMENPDFINYIWGKGLTVEEAYLLVHREDLFAKAAEEAVAEMTRRQDRITENGAIKNRPAITKKNPKDLSDKEVDAIIERARKGERITF